MHFPVADAAGTVDAKAKLDGSVKFYWGDQKHPKVSKTLGTDQTNKKTNAFNKGDKEACEWAWLSAMITMQNRAKQLGADAIINLQSIYQNQDFVSATEYECGVGTFTGGVALRGEFVKL
ncbi:excinuclease ABC subunit A [Stenotrophobium rhamnosiphilum]|uniref:Excinuclease ABC subunit A n=1 Tax=Stenotrophobium rhamnosiphilum TaxID=2029166 RepID=A0A2T5MGV1_9GAMM|nr:excinuclease ABC subunit A [Stenotrophobium rhamnosiphilum]